MPFDGADWRPESPGRPGGIVCAVLALAMVFGWALATMGQ